jgi:hypothetical protein
MVQDHDTEASLESGSRYLVLPIQRCLIGSTESRYLTYLFLRAISRKQAVDLIRSNIRGVDFPPMITADKKSSNVMEKHRYRRWSNWTISQFSREFRVSTAG